MRECLCGTEIPDEGTEWEPGCQHCELLLVIREINEVSEAPMRDLDSNT